MATYFVSLNTPSGAALEPKIARALSPLPPTTDKQRAGHKLYVENCAGCHGAPGSPPPVARSPLGLWEGLWNPTRAYNLVLTVLDGIDGGDGLPGTMPGFRDKFSDDDIEALATYLRTSYTTMPVWGLLAERIQDRPRGSGAATLRFVYDPRHAAASAILRPHPRRAHRNGLRPDHGVRLPRAGHDLRFRQRHEHCRARTGRHGLQDGDHRRQAVQASRPAVRQSLGRRQGHSAFIDALSPERLWPLAIGKRSRRLTVSAAELALHPYGRAPREAYGAGRQACSTPSSSKCTSRADRRPPRHLALVDRRRPDRSSPSASTTATATATPTVPW